MFDKNLLKSELVYHGLTFQLLADNLGIAKSTVSKKVNGYSEWTLSEIQKIGKILGSEKIVEIFFNKKVS